MGPVLIDLKPDRRLLDSNFDGYKLSLQEIPSLKKVLPTPVDRVLLNSSQYTLLHAKLFGLHNHLTGDHWDKNDSVYFTDKEWNVCKVYIDPFTNELIDPIQVWQIPRRRDRNTEDYNISFKFVNTELAVLSDGTGMLYLLNTGTRNDDDQFSVLFSEEVVGEAQSFVISDAVFKKSDDKDDELHVLLQNIQQDDTKERFVTVIHWVTLLKKNVWGQVSLRQIKTKGDVQYLYLEHSCEAVYVITDNGCKFTLNSEHPVQEESATSEVKKVYTWTQNIEDVTVRFPLPENADKKLLKLSVEPTGISVKYNDETLLSGKWHQRVDADITTWNIVENVLEIVLNKNETGLMWPALVDGDQNGENVLDSCIVEQVHERLGHLCTETDAIPQAGGTTFNSQQIEECDFEADKQSTLERLCGTTNQATHKVYLGTHQVILTANLSQNLPPALGVRHDVDVCLWQPKYDFADSGFNVKHEGTLLAFGYVQASKQNRKFCVCPPDMGYSVICESTRHLFIYRQNKPSSELRNRSTGRRIQSVAQQQVVNIPNDEIIGIFASNKILFLLGEEFVLALKL